MHFPCTHPSIHIRTIQDAMAIFEAVRRGILPLVDRRLSASERDELHSGCVFVWEEGEHKQGLERWTDGRRWSQSRLRNDFLYYDEKQPITQQEREMKAARRAEYTNGCSKKPIFRRSDRPSKPNGLTKQTYSTLIRRPDGAGYKKWHIVAYCSHVYDNLPVIDDYDYLRSITIPNGVYLPSRGPLNCKVDGNSCGNTSDDDAPSTPHSLSSPTSYPSPLPANSYNKDFILCKPLSMSSPSPIKVDLRSRMIIDERSDTKFPLVSGASLHRPSTTKVCHPLIPEDVRALRSFHIRL